MNWKSVLTLFLALTGLSHAQQVFPPSEAEQSLQRWRKSRQAYLMDDFGELARYRKANASLGSPAAGEKRVVFFGDSIIEGWNLERFFPNEKYVNRGISGQTTSQLLLRFRQDVVDLHPAAVVILAGTNDIAGNTGPIPLEAIESNFASIAEIARANGIRVVFSSILPVHNYTAASQSFFPLRPMPQISSLNHWLKSYCRAHDHVYLDYFDVMVDGNGYLSRVLADDGLHPNEAGYAKMAPLAESAIRVSLHGRPPKKEKPGN
jgi:lysophospholipase L1-like esterase